MASIPGPRSFQPGRAFSHNCRENIYSRRLVSREFRPDLLRFASLGSLDVVFKGRHSRKFLLTRPGMQARRLDPIFRPRSIGRTRELREKEKEKGRTSTAPKCEGLEEIRLPPPPLPTRPRLRAFPPFRESSAVSSVAPTFFSSPQSRDLLGLFFSPSGNDISLVSRSFVYTPCTSARLQRRTRVRGSVAAPVENRRAMKRTSRPTLYRY